MRLDCRLVLCLAIALFLACGDDDGPSIDRDASSPQDGGSAGDGGEPSDAGAGVDAGDASSAEVDGGMGPAPLSCEALSAPVGEVLRVRPGQANDLPGIVASAARGSTILLADGMYRIDGGTESDRRLIFRTRGVTLRGESGDASRVTLDGEYVTEELLFIAASDVTVAHLTITHAVDHLVHVTTEGAADVTGVRLHDVRFIDGGEQFVKINHGGGGGFVDDGLVECSHFLLTDDGRPNIERNPGGCYTGGIDAHAARGWIVRFNRFEGIYCAGEGTAEHAVHFWRSSRDTLVENNTIIDCARGIGFGLDAGESRVYPDAPYPGIRPISHYGGLIRNNIIYASVPFHDTGIGLEYARGARVHHNTVLSSDTATGFFSSIDYRFSTTEVEIRNNLTRRITRRADASATLAANLEDTPLGILRDPAGGDFHLRGTATIAIDQGVAVEDAGRDMDGQTHDRGDGPDIGADER